MKGIKNLDRSAIDTIRGYCYQFDKTILEILSLKNIGDTIEVEGIEDVDVESGGVLRAVQCKYYENTEYNHSVIAKPIRLMLEHYANNKKFNGKYHLYGHYKAGQDKLTLPILLDTLKDTFLTFTKKNIKYEEHKRLGLSDNDLEDFLARLVIDINASNFEEQQEKVINELTREFACTVEEARHYHYNSAFDVVMKLGCSHNDRKISKSEFIDKSNNSRSLFNIWLYKYKGRDAYLKKIRADLFNRTLNTEPYDRFFIIDVSQAQTMDDIKQCLCIIQKNWSNLSTRASKPFSPYIFLHGNDDTHRNAIKRQIYNEGLIFSDGYNFKGSEFCVNTILKSKESREVKFQFIDTLDDLEKTIETATSRKEIYQFYSVGNIIDLSKIDNSKVTKVQIHDFNDIKDIV